MQGENCRQEIRVTDRSSVNIDRVLNVSSFDEDGILVKTECGNIVVEGEGLSIENLEKSSGVILIKGRIDGVFYLKEKNRRKVIGIFR